MLLQGCCWVVAGLLLKVFVFFQKVLGGKLKTYLSLSKKIGGEVDEQVGTSCHIIMDNSQRLWVCLNVGRLFPLP